MQKVAKSPNFDFLPQNVGKVILVIFFAIFRRSAQSFVILYTVLFQISTFAPTCKLGNREESFDDCFALEDFDDRGDEFFQKAVKAEEFRPKVVNEVDDQTFDMRAIMILICHYHYAAISKRACIFIWFADLEPDDLDQILDFGVVTYLLATCFADVQKLAS